jgi:monolysocardiolipin acyltransferase
MDGVFQDENSWVGGSEDESGKNNSRSVDSSFLDPPWGDYGRSSTVGIVSLVGKCILNVMNSSQFDNVSVLLDAAMKREEGEGLITVSNHASTLDDPMLFCAMFPASFFFTEHAHRRVRWSICAREMCYSNPLFAQFFKSGKTLPIERGKGLHQPVMNVVARAVARGDWVHVFPEGKVHFNDGKGPLLPLKWGVGKLCCDSYLLSGRVPTVIPFHHTGMTSVLPKGSVIPRPGNHVHVQVGEAIDLQDLIEMCKSATREGQECAWKEITKRISSRMDQLSALVPGVTQTGDAGAQPKRA